MRSFLMSLVMLCGLGVMPCFAQQTEIIVLPITKFDITVDGHSEPLLFIGLLRNQTYLYLAWLGMRSWRD